MLGRVPAEETFEQIPNLRPEGGVDPVQEGIAVFALATRSGVSSILLVKKFQ
jgi:hypothetical protein